MTNKIFTASYPGSMMLMGEHAVLRGHPAIACAINLKLHCQLKPRQDNLIILKSALGVHRTSLDQIEMQAPWQFVLQAIKNRHTRLTSGFELKIDSEFSSTLGLGSSAAVTAATVSVIHQWLGQPLSPAQCLETAGHVIHQIQGQASLTDLAATLYGGIVHFSPTKKIVIPIDLALPLTAIYCGYKKRTHEVIAIVDQARQQAPKKYLHIDEGIANLVAKSTQALQHKDLKLFGQLMTQQQAFFHQMNLVTPEIEMIIDMLQQDPQILGAKISGSGLGDCVIALGEISDQTHQKITQQIKHSECINLIVSPNNRHAMRHD